MKISTLYPSQCTLGESPVWHQRRNSIFWVDIEEGVLHELNLETKDVKVWNLDRRVSLVVEQYDDSLVLGVQGGLVKFNPADGSINPIADIDADKPGNRCNDGACDRQGRLFVGTMNTKSKPGAGSLYRIDADMTITKVIDNLTIPNGLVWSPDQARMYFIETMSRTVKSYIYNKQNGDIHYEKVVISVPEDMGYPDGMTIDSEGMLWVALYGGQGVSRWDPYSGKLLSRITLPAPHITSCCFAGDDLEYLVVSSARENLSAEQLEQYPESGNIFMITGLGVRGLTNNKSAHSKHEKDV